MLDDRPENSLILFSNYNHIKALVLVGDAFLSTDIADQVLSILWSPYHPPWLGMTVIAATS